MRAGIATHAVSIGATVFDIMRQTGHTSVKTVRESQFVREASASKLGL